MLRKLWCSMREHPYLINMRYDYTDDLFPIRWETCSNCGVTKKSWVGYPLAMQGTRSRSRQ